MTTIQPGAVLRNRYQVICELGAGGQGQTFEVEDAGQRKVLKVLTRPSSQTIKYFQKEAEILSRLDHPGIPGIDPEDGYFIEALPGQAEPLHCLVMEKVEGVNLHEWMKWRNHQPITEEQAIDWLMQLVKILHEIHQDDLFHLDIKPANIMLKPDSKLALIDFGIAKEVTKTYLTKIAVGRLIPGWATDGYTAPEVLAGTPLPQSDFFSLGRTFVFLLTGQSLGTLSRNKNNDIVWQDQAPQSSSSFAKLLNRLMERKPAHRPLRTQDLIDYLTDNFTPRLLEDVDTRKWTWNEPPQQQPNHHPVFIPPWSEATRSRSRFHHPSRREIGVALLTSLVCAISTVGIRYTGLLQTWELQTFDQMMHLRPPENKDPRILIIEVDDNDIEAYKKSSGQGSLKDRQLGELLRKLEQAQATVIGLDIYLPDPIKNNPQLQQQLQKFKNLYGVCKVKDDGSSSPGIKEPPDITNFGFSDFTGDSDNNVRRHLLAMDPEPISCQTNYAFSLQLALGYLNQKEGLKLDDSQEDWKIGSTVMKRLHPHIGFYHRESDELEGGYQILFNYRNHRLNEIAERIKLSDALKEHSNLAAAKDRIVLIGVTAYKTQDVWFIAGQPEPTWGVWVQANMVSQLINAVLEGRHLLEFWNPWLDGGWILGWGIVGGALAICFRSRFLLITVEAIAIACLISISILLLTNGIIVPVVPPMIVLILSSGVVLVRITANNNQHQTRTF
ncbi:CHASE2 domain-containing protein [Phormidium sp. FACHB-592]|uniref:non-specific serine/threonine protein kinase n=1 Tax=Stenomitos frigidus AS-A4 TaxID=2933935 RepID=A0ABV0KR28_9CYAN|nr:CHASE2 domain-containing protein [Phormidium sp. FACHB-592]MBD2075888.1 CHASE2 domain-containing protein [Phormidium sp. FACHB-592]